jgi:serine/threonine protein kinase
LSQPNQKSIEETELTEDQEGSGSGYERGHMLGGRYQVISCLGKGGMGVVYKVNQFFLNKEMALKTIDKHRITETAMRRFQQEAKTAFAIDHPNVITVNDFGLLDDGTPFLVMELLEGETLGERLKRCTHLSIDEAVAIFIQVCFGMAYAHELGIVHRDIKPNNIMLLSGVPEGTEGSIKIVDFGIAKYSAREGGEVQALTRTGEIFGSPLYMSPEQCLGGAVDHRSDIYSLGCVLFEALTGTPPCVGENALETMMKHQSQVAPTLKEASLGVDFPKGIEEIVATMLAKSPSKRYQNLGVVAHELAATKNGGLVSSKAKTNLVDAKRREEQKISISKGKFFGLLGAVALISAIVAYCAVDLFVNNDNARSNNRATQPKKKTIEHYRVVPNEDSFAETPAMLKVKLAVPSPKHKFIDRNTTLSPECLETIATYPWIKNLDLLGTQVPNENLSVLTKLPLDVLQLTSSELSDDGAIGLCSSKSLKTLYAAWNKLSDRSVSQLATIKTLNVLNISGSDITDASLRALATSKQLNYLVLNKCKKITSAGISLLKASSLRVLELEDTAVTDSALKDLSKLKTLISVNVRHTSVTPVGIAFLCRNSNVSSVSLYGCPNVGNAEIQKLRNEFPHIIFFDKDKNAKE